MAITRETNKAFRRTYQAILVTRGLVTGVLLYGSTINSCYNSGSSTDLCSGFSCPSAEVCSFTSSNEVITGNTSFSYSFLQICGWPIAYSVIGFIVVMCQTYAIRFEKVTHLLILIFGIINLILGIWGLSYLKHHSCAEESYLQDGIEYYTSSAIYKATAAFFLVNAIIDFMAISLAALLRRYKNIRV